MKFGPRVQEELALKANYSGFSIFSSGGNFVHQSRTVFSIMVDSLLSNIPISLNEIGPRV